MKNGPNAARAAEMAIDKGLETALEEGLLYEQKALRMACESGEPVEGAEDFLEKREPKSR